MNLLVSQTLSYPVSNQAQPMLIEVGKSEDALRYYVFLKATQVPHVFELNMHEDAQLLDALRLKRSIKVSMVDEYYRYDALLKIENKSTLVEIFERSAKEEYPQGIFFTT